MHPYRDREAGKQHGSPLSIPLQDLPSSSTVTSRSPPPSQTAPSSSLHSPAEIINTRASVGSANFNSIRSPSSPSSSRPRPGGEQTAWPPPHHLAPLHPHSLSHSVTPAHNSGPGHLPAPLDNDDPFVQTGPGSSPSFFDQNTWRLQPAPSFPDLKISMSGDDCAEGVIGSGYEEETTSPPYGDRTPLTSNAQPVGTSNGGSKGGDAGSEAVRKTSRSRSRRRTSFLGGDLNAAEAGLRLGVDTRVGRSASFSQHLSPISSSQTFQRAGTIMRNMSQRVVNLSNESELVEKQTQNQMSRQGSRSSARSGKNSPSPMDRDDNSQLRLSSHVSPARSHSEIRLSSHSEGRDDGAPIAENKLEGDPECLLDTTRSERPPNPLKGRSLGIFAPDNPIRTMLCDILVHPAIEPLIFVLIIIQTCLLTADAWSSVYTSTQPKAWPRSGYDFAMLALFVIYTLEIVARIIVSGFVINPIEYSTINRQIGLRKALGIKWNALVAPYAAASGTSASLNPLHAKMGTPPAPQHGVLRSFTAAPGGIVNTRLQSCGDKRYEGRVRLANRAFLRHSFNRLDFLAVVAFWIDFCLRVSGAEDSRHIYVFRMLSALRILRLLLITSGTTIILRSLKKAAPLLVHVAFLICFFWLLFAIIGVQSFKSSFRRQCVWVDPQGIEEPFLQSMQFCGGHLSANGTALPWVRADMATPGAGSPKGYVCPSQSLCVEGENPYQGSVGFDNIFQSLELVFVIMSSNTFSDLMYFMMDSDYLAAALYFAAGLIILYFWLINLLVAVITSSFQVIRDESRAASAFTTGQAAEAELEGEDDDPPPSVPKRLSKLARFSSWSYRYFNLLIACDMVAQAFKSASMSNSKASTIVAIEHVTTVLLDLEIVLRFLGDWRGFWRKKRNLFDLLLAVVTTVILIEPIRVKHPVAYSWLTIFQIMRLYRVVLAVPLARDLLTTVFGNTTGLLNLFLFAFLLTFLAAIFATQMFRHHNMIPQQNSQGEPTDTNFGTVYNSFLAMYQILSSEGWTSVLFLSTEYTIRHNTAWISALFFILWFILSNFIVLNMFIAVIQESFDISEDGKRLYQVRAFLQERDINPSNGNLSLSALFRGRNTVRDPTIYGGARTEALFKDAVVKDFLEMGEEVVMSPDLGTTRADSPKMSRFAPPVDTGTLNTATDKESGELGTPGTANTSTAFKSSTSRTLTGTTLTGPDVNVSGETTGVIGVSSKGPSLRSRMRKLWKNTLGRFRSRELNPFYSRLELPRANEELDPTEMARQAIMARSKRKREQEEYLRKYPNYNVSLYLFPPSHPLRVFCQRLVGPSHGETRIDGAIPNGPMWFAFSSFVYAAVVAMVLLACVVTPLYQKEYFAKHGFSVHSWFVWADMGFATLFTIEAMIKIIADGLFWTPNAYLRGIWGVLDTVVLLTLWVNVIANLTGQGQVSRGVGAFKALRALRLLNVSDSARRTFHSIIIRGGTKIASAALVSLGLLIPFAIYGVTIFMGQFRSCTDGDNESIVDLRDCVGEFYATPFQWGFLAPRVAANPYYNFDTFSESLFILFQIVSQEGWSGLMWTSQTLTGIGLQPQTGARPGNAVFFVVFNLLGSVFVLTLFVSVFMRNYTEQTGVAYLTTEQRSWLELRKLLKQVSPSRRPARGKTTKWQDLCYRLAVQRRGRWQRSVTAMLVFHLILLCTETYPGSTIWDLMRSVLLFVLNMFFAANICIRLVGLGWARFRKSRWDIYAPFAVFGTLITLGLSWGMSQSRVMALMNKLFLTSVPLLLIPRSDQLDQLFKTAAASLPTIMNLVATWFVLFLVFAIAFTQTLGLTKFGSSGSGNVNFRTVPKALILLFRTSIGEGWNQLMEDYARMKSPACTDAADFVNGDCGSSQWARFLFISWSILSMYIFSNILISLIFESFSYVYQRSSGLSVLSRDEIRRFKDAWAEFDPNGSGYIAPHAFPRLLGKLTGVFEMRIYTGEFNVRKIVEDCAINTSRSELPEAIGMDDDSKTHFSGPAELDIARLTARVNQIPVAEIQNRRQRLNMFHEEVLVSAHPYKGISFTTLLMTLAHYKLIDDSKSLRLTEFLHRRARLQRVDEAVRRNIVRGFLHTVYWRRRFRRWQRAHHGCVIPDPDADIGVQTGGGGVAPSLNKVKMADGMVGVAVPEIVVTGGQTGSISGDSSLLQVDTWPTLHPDDAIRGRSAPASSSGTDAKAGPTTSPNPRSRSGSTARSRLRSASPAISVDPFADTDPEAAVSAWDRLAVDDIAAMDEAPGRQYSFDRSPTGRERSHLACSPIVSPKSHSRVPSQDHTHTRTSSIQQSPERPSRTARLLSGLGISRRPSRSGSLSELQELDLSSDILAPPRFGSVFATDEPNIYRRFDRSHAPIRSPSDSSALHSPTLFAPTGMTRPRARTTAGESRDRLSRSGGLSSLGGSDLLGVAAFLGVRGHRDEATASRSSGVSLSSGDVQGRDGLAVPQSSRPSGLSDLLRSRSTSGISERLDAAAAAMITGDGATDPSSSSNFRTASPLTCNLPLSRAGSVPGPGLGPDLNPAPARDPSVSLDLGQASGARSRAPSMRVQDVLSDLDESAWGGALKRSATRSRNNRTVD